MADKYNFHGHDAGLVITQPESGKFVERPMTTAELMAREPAHRISIDIYRHANYAGACYHEIWQLIASAAQAATAAELAPLVRAARAYLESETEVAMNSYRELRDGQWVWNDDVWRAEDPAGFELAKALRDAISVAEASA